MRRRLISIISYFFIPCLLWAQPREHLEIVPSPDTFIKHSKTDQGPLIELYGNPHLRQGKTEMFCKRVQWWKEKGELVIEKDVRIFDEFKELIAEYVYYYVDTGIYKAQRNVTLKDSVRQVTADQIQYYKFEDREIADGNVVLDDWENNIKIFCGHAELDNEKEYALLVKDPIFVRLDSLGKEEIRITGLKMELFEGGDKAVVTDSVHILHKEATAHCGVAEFYREKNEIILRNAPLVWQKFDRLSGNTVHLFVTKKNELNKVIVEQDAMVTSRVDTTGVSERENKLTGQLITMFFENKQLFKVVVEKKATSYYYVVEDDEDKGLNRIIGDKIIVFLKNRKIVKIRIESNPQLSEGIFYPKGIEPAQEGKKDKWH